jgi:hypothetical protein
MRILSLGAAAVLTALTAGQALARDNCPRLESTSLVIVIPEGGCNADSAAILAAAKEVTVIRGAGHPNIIRTASIAAAPKARVRIHPQGMRGGAAVIFIDIDQSRH